MALMKVAMVFGGLFAFSSGFLFSTGMILKQRAESSPSTDSSEIQTMQRNAAREIIDTIADEYDERTGYTDDFMMLRLRKRLLQNAKGEVLEVASGTGRNLGLYRLYPDIPVSKVTVTDHSERMLENSRRKVVRLQKEAAKRGKNVFGTQELSEGAKKHLRDLPQFSSEVADVHNMKYPDSSFDTVVDTFGICSFEDPTAALKEMQRVCKKDGKVLLLEHGRGKVRIINFYLDISAKGHAKRFACWHNRDILKHVEEAGLQIEKVSIHNFSTTYFIVASPNPKLKE